VSGAVRTWRHPYRGTTRHLQSVYPFMADAGLGSDGVVIGRDGLRRTFCYDPFVLYQKGLLNGPNMLVLGDIGYGKSALTKRRRPNVCAAHRSWPGHQIRLPCCRRR
jgi:hypothetical protein